jgi:hypothetical protein
MEQPTILKKTRPELVILETVNTEPSNSETTRSESVDQETTRAEPDIPSLLTMIPIRSL